MALAASSSTASAFSPWIMASLRSALPAVSCTCSLSARFHVPARRPAPKSLTSGLSLQKYLRSFSGLSPVLPMLSNSPGYEDYENVFIKIDNGSRFFAMRHGKRVPKLNRPPDQRRALIRGLTTQLLKHGRIKTTRPRARAIRKYVDKMITLAKDGSLHKRRQALGFIYEKQIVHALFAEVQDRYGSNDIVLKYKSAQQVLAFDGRRHDWIELGEQKHHYEIAEDLILYSDIKILIIEE